MKLISISIISMLLFGCISISQKMEHSINPKQLCDSQISDDNCGIENCTDHCDM